MDEIPMVPVIQHVLLSLRGEPYSPDITLVLQPTAPLRRTEHIDQGLDLLLSSNANSVVSVTTIPSHHHPEWQFTIDEGGLLKSISGQNLTQIQPRRQDLQPTYTRNGAIYAVRTKAFEKTGSLYPSPCLAYVMPGDVSVNIDREEDFWLAERYLLAQEQENVGKSH
jgi:N-acylneuraminate cytidylyltransferase